MGKAKEAALQMIASLPDDCTWDDVEYRVTLRAKIERGLDDVAAGRLTPHEGVKAEIREWLASLGRTGQNGTSESSSTGSLATP